MYKKETAYRWPAAQTPNKARISSPSAVHAMLRNGDLRLRGLLGNKRNGSIVDAIWHSCHDRERCRHCRRHRSRPTNHGHSDRTWRIPIGVQRWRQRHGAAAVAAAVSVVPRLPRLRRHLLMLLLLLTRPTRPPMLPMPMPIWPIWPCWPWPLPCSPGLVLQLRGTLQSPCASYRPFWEEATF